MLKIAAGRRRAITYSTSITIFIILDNLLWPVQLHVLFPVLHPPFLGPQLLSVSSPLAVQLTTDVTRTPPPKPQEKRKPIDDHKL